MLTSHVFKPHQDQTMYLIDTNVISEIRKGERANAGVQAFFRDLSVNNEPIYLSVITIGELRRGIEHIRHHTL